MNVPSFDEITAFVREQTGYSGPLTEATTLQADMGIRDELLWELLGIFAARFHVDVAGFRWYFHSARVATLNLGGLHIALPPFRGQQIPISLGMLHEFARRGQWAVDYPPQNPASAWLGISTRQLALLAFLIGILVIALLRFLR